MRLVRVAYTRLQWDRMQSKAALVAWARRLAEEDYRRKLERWKQGDQMKEKPKEG